MFVFNCFIVIAADAVTEHGTHCAAGHSVAILISHTFRNNCRHILKSDFCTENNKQKDLVVAAYDSVEERINSSEVVLRQ